MENVTENKICYYISYGYVNSKGECKIEKGTIHRRKRVEMEECINELAAYLYTVIPDIGPSHPIILGWHELPICSHIVGH